MSHWFPITNKLVKRVESPLFEIGIASVTNRRPKHIGASFSASFPAVSPPPQEGGSPHVNCLVSQQSPGVSLGVFDALEGPAMCAPFVSKAIQQHLDHEAQRKSTNRFQQAAQGLVKSNLMSKTNEKPTPMSYSHGALFVDRDHQNAAMLADRHLIQNLKNQIAQLEHEQEADAKLGEDGYYAYLPQQREPSIEPAAPRNMEMERKLAQKKERDVETAKARRAQAQHERIEMLKALKRIGARGAWATVEIEDHPFVPVDESGNIDAKTEGVLDIEYQVNIANLGDSRAFGLKRADVLDVKPQISDALRRAVQAGGVLSSDPRDYRNDRRYGDVSRPKTHQQGYTANPSVKPDDELFPFSALEERRMARAKRLVPLTSDHGPKRPEEQRRIQNAGGFVDAATGCVCGDPTVNVSRAFGHLHFKDQDSLSSVKQMVIATPGTGRWTMKPGDVLVVATHALFETQGGSSSSVEALCDAVIDSLESCNKSVEDAASDLCDFALKYGSSRNLTVAVLRVKRTTGKDLLEHSNSGSVKPKSSFTVTPGRLFPQALTLSEAHRDAVHGDCARCQTPMPLMLAMRYAAVFGSCASRLNTPGAPPSLYSITGSLEEQDVDIDYHRHLHKHQSTVTVASPTSPSEVATLKRFAVGHYPIEYGLLMAAMEEEAEFFRFCPFSPKEVDQYLEVMLKHVLAQTLSMLEQIDGGKPAQILKYFDRLTASLVQKVKGDPLMPTA